MHFCDIDQYILVSIDLIGSWKISSNLVMSLEQLEEMNEKGGCPII